MDTPTSPVTSGLPLFFVITVTAIKQVRQSLMKKTSVDNKQIVSLYDGKSGELLEEELLMFFNARCIKEKKKFIIV